MEADLQNLQCRALTDFEHYLIYEDLLSKENGSQKLHLLTLFGVGWLYYLTSSLL